MEELQTEDQVRGKQYDLEKQAVPRPASRVLKRIWIIAAFNNPHWYGDPSP